MNFRNKILVEALFVLGVIFVFFLFQNIAYPLLWNDEAETVMFGKRVLEYGYPKVYNGKNPLDILPIPVEAYVDGTSGAYLGTRWGHFYFSVIGVLLAEMVNDIYLKTALLRIPFAFIGLVGLVIMALSIMDLWKKDITARLIFLVCYVFLELLSIPLILHLRQVRYYSIVIFLFACIFYTYINYRLLEKVKLSVYISIMTLLLLLLFNTFLPVYFVFIATIGLYECLEFLKGKRIRDFLVNVAPLFVSFIMTIPLLAFFRTFRIYQEWTKLYNFSFAMQCKHVLAIVSFFRKYEFLYVILFVKIVLGLLWFYRRGSERYFPAVQENKAITSQKLWVSNFLSLFSLVYILIISRTPLSYIFERYFITLQPVLAAMVLLDIFIIFELLSRIGALTVRSRIKKVFLFAVGILFILNGSKKIELVKNYIYEISHQYRGPLDFAIPYIKSRYKNPENLVIATNYEECAYAYYLGSQVIVDSAGDNLKMRPDIIIFRKAWGRPGSRTLFNVFFQRDKYERIPFPVFDYPVNNIPDIGAWYFPHLFKTKIAENKDKRLDIYVRAEEPEMAQKDEKARVEEVESLNRLGIEQGKAGNLDKAISLFTQAVSLEPDHAESYNNLGYAYYLKGDYKRAEEYFKKALEIDPDHKKARINLDYLYDSGYVDKSSKETR